ncbi:MAG: hypothetical protein ABIO65_06605 [Nitrospiria bacterium]
MGRSAGALAAGSLVWLAIVAAKFGVIAAWFPGALPGPGVNEFPRPAWLAFVLATDVLAMILGGYVADMVAPRAGLVHAAALGGVMVATGLAAIGFGWEGTPIWYQVVLVSIALPAVD